MLSHSSAAASTTTTTEDCRAHAQRLAEFIAEYGFLWQHHAVDFYTTDLWNDDARFPPQWRDPMLGLGMHELLALAAARDGDVCEHFDTSMWPESLITFVRRSRELPLCRDPRSVPLVSDLTAKLPELDKVDTVGMSAKKVLEVQLLSALIIDTLQPHDESNGAPLAIMDLGSGQGYLDTVLAFTHHRAVLAVDDNTVQTCGAKRRVGIVGRGYEGTGSVRVIQRRVEVGDDLGVDVGCVVGLHSCGDLTCAAIKHFLEDPKTRVLCVVGCCYNRLSEDLPDVGDATTWTSTKDITNNPRGRPVTGYPLSEFYRSRPGIFALGYTARTLGCQATDRWTRDVDGARESYRRHFYRALLQVVIEERGLVRLVKTTREDIVVEERCCAAGHAMSEVGAIVVGKMRPTAFAKGFAHYARIALGRLGVDVSSTPGLSDSVLEEYETRYAPREKELAAVWTLRAMMGAAIESLILLDRFLYLVESHGDSIDVRLFPLFDVVDSPRNMVIVAEKR